MRKVLHISTLKFKWDPLNEFQHILSKNLKTAVFYSGFDNIALVSILFYGFIKLALFTLFNLAFIFFDICNKIRQIHMKESKQRTKNCLY
jgi:hypothetical protein